MNFQANQPSDLPPSFMVDTELDLKFKQLILSPLRCLQCESKCNCIRSQQLYEFQKRLIPFAGGSRPIFDDELQESEGYPPLLTRECSNLKKTAECRPPYRTERFLHRRDREWGSGDCSLITFERTSKTAIG